VREADGLALSSRNAHLSPTDRARATALHRALSAVQDAVSAGERDPNLLQARALAVLDSEGIDPDYLKLVSPDTLVPVTQIEDDFLAVLAAHVGETRLIDNQLIQPSLNHEREVATRKRAPTVA
jgi:pantoate--beta-alanine ligase